MKNKIYIVYSGSLHSDTSFDSVWNKKKDAIEALKKLGCKFKKDEDVYYRHDTGTYYKIDRITTNELFRTW